MRDEFLSEEDLDLRNLDEAELYAWWDEWLRQAQATNEDDQHLYAHGVFRMAPEWRQPRETPDPQILETARQYKAAWDKLGESGPSGVLYPRLHCAVIAVELYLKCLAAQAIDMPGDDGVCTVYAEPIRRGHGLVPLLQAIPDDVRGGLESDFRRRFSGGELDAELERYEGAFEASRYPYEPSNDVSQYRLDRLNDLLAFLADFVQELELRETIES
jgi:hypothetical protein